MLPQAIKSVFSWTQTEQLGLGVHFITLIYDKYKEVILITPKQILSLIIIKYGSGLEGSA